MEVDAPTIENKGNIEPSNADQEQKNLIIERQELIGNYLDDPTKVFKDDYIVKSVIGTGVRSVVRECVLKVSGEHRAVKIFRRKNLSEQEEQNIKKEIETLINFDHPNLIKFYGAYKDDKRYYIVTELCAGGPLLDILTTGKS